MAEEDANDFNGAHEEDFLPVEIFNVALSNLGFLVMLKLVQNESGGRDSRTLPIWIGTNEAQSIALAYNEQEPPRPLTHDLLKNMLTALDCEIVKIQVTAILDNTFYGRIHFRKSGIVDMDIDSRPSDAIALALRYKAPIYIHRDVWEASAVLMNEDAKPEANHPLVATVESQKISAKEKLKSDLDKAITEERYEEAAKLRDALKNLSSDN